MYKAYFHSCTHCMGPNRCADPLMYQQLLYPQMDDIDKYLAMLQSRPGASRLQTRFAPAWKARRYELEVLADRAAEKHDRAMRIGTLLPYEHWLDSPCHNIFTCLSRYLGVRDFEKPVRMLQHIDRSRYMSRCVLKILR